MKYKSTVLEFYAIAEQQLTIHLQSQMTKAKTAIKTI